MRLAQATQRLDAARVFRTRWLPVFAYVALIFTLSAQPHLVSPLHFQNGDKVAHLCEYGVLGFLLVRAVRASYPSHGVLAVALRTLLLGLAIAAADEKFQAFIPGRESSVLDWFADSIGITLAQIVFFAVAKDEEL